MINQFTSVRDGTAIGSNHCDDVDVREDVKAIGRICTNDEVGVSIDNPGDCSKISGSACEMQNECGRTDGEPNECAMGATAATKTEMKINFSVDRLLSKAGGNDGNVTSSNKLNNQWRIGKKSVLTIDQLLSSSTRNDQQSTGSKQIVRPMPVRYLHTSAQASGAVKSAATMYSVTGPQSIHMQHYFKYINSNASHFSPSQQMSTMPSSAPVCSRGRFMDTFVSQKSSSFASTENVNAAGGAAVSTASPSNNHVKRKRSWSRAVFSQLQRKGLEIQFQIQKYITKPDRRKLAARLGLTDAQVKVWFQNRRMKWRHTRETKLNADKQIKCAANGVSDETTNATSEDDDADELCSADGTSDDDEIDVVAE